MAAFEMAIERMFDRETSTQPAKAFQAHPMLREVCSRKATS